MKKLLTGVLLLIALGGGALHAQPVDMIVLLDTSESMLPFFNNVTNYLIKDIVFKQLRSGDTFHLISFASRPEIEISRQIESQSDLNDIIDRILLLQPLGRYTDLVLAVKYLYQYAVDLPLDSKKVILVLTDGIHDPPPGSSFPNKFGPNGEDLSQNRQQIVDVANEIRRRGWEVHFLQFPLNGIVAPSSTTQPGVNLLSGEPGTTQVPSPSGAPGAAAAPAGSGSVSPASNRAASGAGPTSTAPSPQKAVPGGTGTPNGSAAAGGTVVAPGAANGARSTAPGGAPGPTGKVGPESDALLKDFAQAVGSPIHEYQGTPKEDLAHVATGAPGLLFPPNLGRIGYDVVVPFTIRNYAGSPMLVELDQVLYDGRNILQDKASVAVKAQRTATLRAHLRLPVTLKPGPASIQIDLVFGDSLLVFPHEGTLSFTLRSGFLGLGTVWIVLLAIVFTVVLIACVLLVYFFIRRVVESLGAAIPPAVHSRAHLQYDSRRIAVRSIELKVQGQNPNIGGRNIHPMGSGSRRTVGGGGSSFLIYLYPLPAHIGEIAFDGSDFVFTPARPEFFPELAGPLAGCLGRTIRVQTREKRDVYIVFREYLSPLDEVNRIMHMIDRPGLAQPAETSGGDGGAQTSAALPAPRPAERQPESTGAPATSGRSKRTERPAG